MDEQATAPELRAAPTPAEAQAALHAARATRPGTGHDRRVYALGTALFGLLLGLYLAVVSAWDPHGARGYVMIACYAGLQCGIALWQKRAARTVPRGAKRLGYRGLVLSGVAALVGIMVSNAVADGGPISIPVSATVGVLAALPLVLAGWLIDRRRE